MSGSKWMLWLSIVFFGVAGAYFVLTEGSHFLTFVYAALFGNLAARVSKKCSDRKV
jgi:drug/metabolite transporter (DMT)-like permease